MSMSTEQKVVLAITAAVLIVIMAESIAYDDYSHWPRVVFRSAAAIVAGGTLFLLLKND